MMRGEQHASTGDDEGDAWTFGSGDLLTSAVAPVRKYDPYYKMDHPRRGHAIIFNHRRFDRPNLPEREWSDADAENLKRTFGQLGFDFTVHEDLIASDLEYVVNKTAKLNHGNCDCVVIAVLTYGVEGVLYARDTSYKPEILWNAFGPDNSPTLAGKPKLFFIQACQEDQLSVNQEAPNSTELDGPTTPKSSYKIPNCADLMISFSKIPGFYFNEANAGSLYVLALCELLNEKGTKFDLLTILTLVKQRVAQNFEMWRNDPRLPGYTHFPCSSMRLTRIVKFPAKNTILKT